MYIKILFLVAVCVKIAFSEDCTQKVEPSSQMYECWAVKEMGHPKILDDPCVKNAMEKPINSIECIVECLYNEHNLMLNDSIIMDNLKEYYQVIITDDEKRNLFIDGAEACNKLGKTFIIENFGHLSRPSKCEGYYTLFDYCIVYNALARCPAEILRKTEYCRSQVKFLNECIFNKTENS